MAAAAALLIASASAGTVWTATSDERELAEQYHDILATAHGQYVDTRPVGDADERQVGHVFIYQGGPSWLFVVLEDAPESGFYEIAVTTGDGTEMVTTCQVKDRECGTGATVDVDHQTDLGGTGDQP